MRYLFLVLSMGLTMAQAQPKGPAKYLYLISIDGFRPDFYLDSRWPTPNLQRLAREGVHAKGMRPVVPSVTYPDHITMITGALPATHGIYYNSPFGEKGWEDGSYSQYSQIKSPTLWEAVKKAGGKVASLRWPVSGGAPVDFNFTSTRNAQGIAPASFREEIESKVLGKFDVPANYQYSDFDYYQADIQTTMVGAYLIRTYRPNFMTLHLVATDHFQHEQGREGEKVRQSVGLADAMIGQLVEATRAAGIMDSTAFIIIGDHGFEDRHTQLAWNSLLIKEGLAENKPDRGNWKACFKDQFLHLKDPNDKATLARVRSLLENQPPNIRKLYRIVERDELDRYGVDPAVVLAVHPIDGVVCTSRYNHPDLVQSTPGGSHGLIPDRPNLFTGFIAVGPGLRKGMVVPHLGIEDVAPHIAYLLGLDFKAPDGVMYPGIIVESLIKGY